MKRGRLKDPAWMSGPTYPEPTSSEHFIDPQPVGYDVDGFGVDEAEMVEGEPLLAIQEAYECGRDGCDAAERRRILFTTHTLHEDEMDDIRALSGVDEAAAFVYENHERVDEETIEVGGITITAEKVVGTQASGACYGTEEPDWEEY